MCADGPGRVPEVKAIQQTRRLLANARERTRVHTISAAFEALRKQVRLSMHTGDTYKHDAANDVVTHLITGVMQMVNEPHLKLCIQTKLLIDCTSLQRLLQQPGSSW